MKSPDWILSIWPIHLTKSQMQSFSRLSAIRFIFVFVFLAEFFLFFKFLFHFLNIAQLLYFKGILLFFFLACVFYSFVFFLFLSLARSLAYSFWISCLGLASWYERQWLWIAKSLSALLWFNQLCWICEAMWLMATILDAHTYTCI